MKSILCLIVIFLTTGIVFGQCTKDTDCKGNRLCVNGECVDPESSSSSASSDKKSSPKGWGHEAGIVGFAVTPVPIILSIVAEVNKDQMLPTVPTEVTGISIAMITVPIVFAGGSSSRSHSNNGNIGLRIGGWVSYGLSVGLGLGLIPFAIAEVTPPPSFLVMGGIFGGVSCSLMGADAYISSNQGGGRHSAVENDPKVFISLGPTYRGAALAFGVNF